MNPSNSWNWLKDLEAFQQSRDSLLSRSPTHRSERQQGMTMMTEWSPAMEVSENDREYVIKVKLAEVMKEDVKVTADKGTLTILAHRRFATEEKDKNPQRVKLAWGSFGRTFSFPDDAGVGSISAEFKDSLLVVRLVKGEKAGSQGLEVTLS